MISFRKSANSLEKTNFALTWKEFRENNLLHTRTECKNVEFSLTEKKNSWNQLICNFFSKTVSFTKFLSKSMRENFCNFYSIVTVWKSTENAITLIWRKKCRFSVKIMIVFQSSALFSRFLSS